MCLSNRCECAACESNFIKQTFWGKNPNAGTFLQKMNGRLYLHWQQKEAKQSQWVKMVTNKKQHFKKPMPLRKSYFRRFCYSFLLLRIITFNNDVRA
jgi:hypothetical protein